MLATQISPIDWSIFVNSYNTWTSSCRTCLQPWLFFFSKNFAFPAAIADVRIDTSIQHGDDRDFNSSSINLQLLIQGAFFSLTSLLILVLQSKLRLQSLSSHCNRSFQSVAISFFAQLEGATRICANFLLRSSTAERWPDMSRPWLSNEYITRKLIYAVRATSFLEKVEYVFQFGIVSYVKPFPCYRLHFWRT